MRFISFAFSFIAVLVFSVAASAQTFSNTTAITSGDASIGNPYPSNINVTGVTGTVSKVTVKLNNLSHTYPDDIGVLLVGPTGVKVRLMTDTGGGSGGSGGGAISNVTITFDDAAAGFLPDGVTGNPPITTGTYKPTQGTGGAGQGTAHPTNFPSPAPAAPYALTLSSFNGLNANGVWSLYVDDDAGGDTGSFAGGWSITFTVAAAPAGKLFDFTGSGRTSFVTLAFPTNGLIRWNIAGNPASTVANQAFIRSVDFGRVGDGETFGDAVVPNDYLGDQKTELAVYRDTDSIYYVAETPTGTGGVTLARALPFGNSATDVPGAEGDYDGDGKADYTVVRVNASNQLTWYILTSSTGTVSSIRFGDLAGLTTPGPNESAVTIFPGADFTGDGKDELILVRRNAATPDAVTYYIGDASNGNVVAVYTFGNYQTDYTLPPDDYTGDGRADLVTVRNNASGQVWYINNPVTNVTTGTTFGIQLTAAGGDYQIRGDYDGDGRQDIAVWRRSNRTFYWINSSNGSLQSQFFGNAGDVPLGALATF